MDEEKYTLQQVTSALESWVDKFGRDVIYDGIRGADVQGVLCHDFAGEMASQAADGLISSIAGYRTETRIERFLEQDKELDRE